MKHLKSYVSFVSFQGIVLGKKSWDEKKYF